VLAKRIIPCLDVKDGIVVKGTKFINLRHAGDPVKLAQRYDREGADELVFLDITASAEKRKIIIDVARRTAEKVFIPFTVGGGISDLETIRALLKAGADKVSINTAAVKNPDFIRQAAERFGSQCIVVAIDAKYVDSTEKIKCGGRRTCPPCQARRGRRAADGGRWEVYINGGRTPTGIDAIKWAKKAEKFGAGEILLTSMDADGTKAGYDLELTKTIADSVRIPVIASGGAGKPIHIYDAFSKANADAALIASLFHYQEIKISNLKTYLRRKGIIIRN
jgi:cyclase